MKKYSFKNGVSVVVESNDINIDTVIVSSENGKKDVHIFRKMDDGTIKELKKLCSVEKSKIINAGSGEKEAVTTITPTSNNNKVVPINEKSKREISWRKFRTAIVKAGGINIYMKSRRADSSLENLLLSYPDFEKGMKLYEAGCNGAWSLLTERSIESVRRTYKRYYMDLDQLLAA